ncbi:hypothetical protein CC2G_001653 [Coprinopsis cinerea AmutBmut pab1-1]|nr:hypothetical protein CC2G_001653 [Coprinopsis cinerea AmutBmut pab1-1]
MENAIPNAGIHFGIDWVTKAHASGLERCSAQVIDPLSASFFHPHIEAMIDPSSRLLTPNTSGDENSDTDADETVVSVSSSFYPGAHEGSHDAILRTSDSVLFYLHSPVLQSVSTRAFESFIGSAAAARVTQDEIIDIPETSTTLNVIVHALYNTSCAQHAPTLDVLESAIDRMPSYNITPNAHILPGSHLYGLLLTHAPLSPLRVYALAAHHQLHELAVHASSHTLAIPLSSITDDIARRIGAIYLKKLMTLHMARQEHFKNIILQPPELHLVSKACSFQDQKRLSRAWALAAAYFAWDGKNDVPINELQRTFASLEDGLDCDQCKGTLRKRIKEIVVQWAAAKVGLPQPFFFGP